MITAVLEKLSRDTLEDATRLFIALWPNCSHEEEYRNCLRILDSGRETLQLAKVSDQYIGLIYLSLREEYIEGTNAPPVAYIEGIYVMRAFRKMGIGASLVAFGERWAISQGATAYASDSDINNRDGIDFHIRTGFREARRVVCFVKTLIDVKGKNS